MTNNFYVYAHYRLDTNEIFYIGKGNNYRAHSDHSRNKYWKNIVNKYGLRIELLHDNLTEIFAFELEANYIAAYGRKDLREGLLVNMTDGWEGMSGNIQTNKVKEKIRLAHIGKHHNIKSLEKMRISKLGKNNPRYKKSNYDLWLEKYGKEEADKKKEHQRKAVSGKFHNNKTKIMLKNKGIEQFKTPELKKAHSLLYKPQGYPDLISPNGNVIKIISSLRQFCRENNLNCSALSALIHGKFKQHKGWKLCNK